jgi:excisionase family DNA binding protein
MPLLFVPQEEDFKKWIREALREEWTAVAGNLTAAGSGKDEPLLTRKEIAGYLRISLVTLGDWVKRGLPCYRKGRRVLFLKSEVLQWVKENRYD